MKGKADGVPKYLQYRISSNGGIFIVVYQRTWVCSISFLFNEEGTVMAGNASGAMEKRKFKKTGWS